MRRADAPAAPGPPARSVTWRETPPSEGRVPVASPLHSVRPVASVIRASACNGTPEGVSGGGTSTTSHCRDPGCSATTSSPRKEPPPVTRTFSRCPAPTERSRPSAATTVTFPGAERAMGSSEHAVDHTAVRRRSTEPGKGSRRPGGRRSARRDMIVPSGEARAGISGGAAPVHRGPPLAHATQEGSVPRPRGPVHFAAFLRPATRASLPQQAGAPSPTHRKVGRSFCTGLWRETHTSVRLTPRALRPGRGRIRLRAGPAGRLRSAAGG
jgi:hypothetical protein